MLGRADIGIAMGAMGSDAAIEAADVVLMDDDPLQIAKAIKISRKCLRIVYQNIVFAIGIKLICLALGALGICGHVAGHLCRCRRYDSGRSERDPGIVCKEALRERIQRAVKKIKGSDRRSAGVEESCSAEYFSADPVCKRSCGKHIPEERHGEVFQNCPCPDGRQPAYRHACHYYIE